MGFINERKNILRAEDGPLVAVDKNGNEVQIGNGSISCDSLKCDETITIYLVDIDAAFDALGNDNPEYFTQPLTETATAVGKISGFVKSYENVEGDVSIENKSISGVFAGEEFMVEEIQPINTPLRYFVTKMDEGDPILYKGDELSFKNDFFDIEYSYYYNSGTPSSYGHNMIIRQFADVPIYIEIQVETEDSVVSSFTYSFSIPNLIPEG